MARPISRRGVLLAGVGAAGALLAACAQTPPPTATSAPAKAADKPAAAPTTAPSSAPTTAPAAAAKPADPTKPAADAKPAAAATTAPAASPADKPAAAAPAAAKPSGQRVSVLVWDQFTSKEANDASKQVYAEFAKKYPNVEIKQESIQNAQLQQTAKTALAAGTGPDVFYYDVGPGNVGVLQRAGLLRDLEDFERDYKWKQRIFRWGNVTSTFNGKLSGIGFEAEFTGLFYDAPLFQKEGYKAPETFDDLLAYVNAAKGKSAIPISFSMNPGVLAYHPWSGMVANIVGRDEVEKMITGAVPAKWDRPEIARATKLFFVDLAKAGAFPPSVNSLAGNDANDLFYAGKAPMLATGTWSAGGITSNMKDKEIGLIPLPSVDGKPRYYPASMGSGWYMSAKSKSPAEGVQFMDFQVTPEAAKIWAEIAGFVAPIKFDHSQWKLSPLVRRIVDALQAAGPEGQSASANFSYFIHHFAPPSFLTALRTGSQALIAGQKTPDQQVAELQKAWDEGFKD